MPTQGERLSTLEAQVSHLVRELQETNIRFREINDKLAELLALKHKGTGFFWLATTLFGTSLLGVVTSIMSWYRGS